MAAAAADCEHAIGVIGAGNMAKAMLYGWINSGLFKPDQIIVSAPSERNLHELKVKGYRTTHNNGEVVATHSGVLVVAVKPHLVGNVLIGISHLLTERHLVVSVASGLTLATLSQYVPLGVAVIRVMPNLASRVNCSATVFCRQTTEPPPPHFRFFLELMRSLGTYQEVPEVQMDAYCGMTGSGLAFVYLMMSALSDGGVKMGIPRHVANATAAQVFLGASKMALESGCKSPAEMMEQVASPGGTTIYGLHELEKSAVRGAIVTAVEAATQRAHQLGGGGHSS